MKLIYTGAFLITSFSLAYVLFQSKKNKREIAPLIRNIMYVGLISVLSNLVLMLSVNERICEVAYSVFFSSVTWLLFFIWLFVLDFAGYRRPKSVGLGLAIALAAADSLSMFLNFFFQHAYTCYAVASNRDEIYYRIHALVGYQLHLAVCYFLAAVILVLLVIKSIRTEAMYRGKYLVILGMIFMVLLWDADYVLAGALVDTSIIGYAFGALAIYYYACVFVPGELLKQTLFQVVKDMKDSIIIFDADNKLMHVNESGKKLLEFCDREAQRPDSRQENTQDWLRKHPLKNLQAFESSWDLGEGEQERHIKVFFHRMEDGEKHYLGCFFIFQDHTEEVNSLRKERYAATHDPLTGIYNRAYFEEQCKRQLEREPEERWLMLCADIRRFKLVNDIFGVETGDRLLKRIAQGLRENALPGEIYGRLQNDCFAFLVRKKDYEERRIMAMTEEMMYIDQDVSYPVRMSIGAYEILEPEISISAMCDRAFIAMGTIKEAFDTQIAYYDAELRASVLHEQELITQLDEALTSGQFAIYLQPQTDLNGNVLGAEALVRWMHPKEGLLLPGKFVELLERNGTISRLDCHVWELACRQLRAWKEQGREQMYISVNISPKDFYFLDIYRTFTGLVEYYGIDPSKLKLEITETAVMQDLKKQLHLITKLRQYGFVVEMDDFGSGYSSLNMLKDIQVDLLKLDMAFLGNTEDEARAKKIIRMIVELSDQLGIQVLTEGVETREQVEFLKSIGCTLFQGYYFAKPMPVKEFEDRYMNQTEQEGVESL